MLDATTSKGLVLSADTIELMGRSRDWRAHAAEVLGRSGHRTSRARDAVLDLLAGNDCCASAQEIFDELRRRRRSVGLATVYRVLDLLQEKGLVQRLDFGDLARYEPVLPTGEHHHHLVCAECGKVEPFADDPLERALDRLSGRLGYALEAHDVVLRGSCAQCRVA